ncbi:NACHT domain-containing protein [Luteimonas aestuarii]|uniref:NACHT domain-containing protein n=1 Tax=Luteimonas aestuarii TaxID=453837 RepID=A0A4R5TJP4_9GAMM|nr:NACHT domain-containing protein [Luteimonas aestuarii]TDK22332.1 NACHT domain-containing protein [Luteimonas aestuarii]
MAAGELGAGLVIVGAVVKGATSALVSKYFDQIVSPFLRGISGLRNQQVIKKNLFRYIKSVEYRTRTLPSIAIPSGVFQLESVYEPLTVRSESDGSLYEVDSYPRGLFSHSRCVALTDDAGMGKSTLAKFIVRSAINEGRSIPLLVELRRLRAGVSIVDSLCSELAGGDSSSSAGTELINLFANGNFVFVFDGYDELEDEIRGKITDEINELAARFVFCYFLLTSRKEYGSALFPEFAHFEICKLSEEQAHSLIRRYDQGRGLAKPLLNKIEEAEVHDFLGNPLLVTLLYKAFDYRQSIPPKRSIFFRQVYEALFQDHDLSKGGSFERKKQCALDVDDFHKVLRSLGFITFKSGRVSYSPEEFSEHLKAAVERSSISSDWQKIRQDLIQAVPIFAKDGVEYRWSHKSFQEYFAAQYLAIDLASRREEALRKIFQSSDVLRFREVLRFIAEADLALVREICIDPLLRSACSGGGSDDDIAIECIFASADVFYVGGFRGAGRGNFERVSVQKYVHERLGFDTSKNVTRTVTSRADGGAILVALKENGLRFILLSSLDPENFGGSRRAAESKLFLYWRERFQDDDVHLNGVASSLTGDEAVTALASATNLPVVTRTTINAVRSAAEARKAAMATSVLDDF